MVLSSDFAHITYFRSIGLLNDPSALLPYICTVKEEQWYRGGFCVAYTHLSLWRLHVRGLILW